MQRIKFILPCKGFSLNAAYYSTRKVKTKDCRDWEDMVLAHLLRIPELRPQEDFVGEVEVWLNFYYPESIFWTKQRLISAKTFDVDNSPKLLIDLIFGGCLKINDKFIRRIHSEKNPGATWAIEVILELKPYDDPDGTSGFGSGSNP